MTTPTLKGEELLQVINQAKNDTKTGLLDVFTTKLERLAAYIRNNRLSPAESAELLEQEVETMTAQHRNDI